MKSLSFESLYDEPLSCDQTFSTHSVTALLNGGFILWLNPRADKMKKILGYVHWWKVLKMHYEQLRLVPSRY